MTKINIYQIIDRGTISGSRKRFKWLYRHLRYSMFESILNKTSSKTWRKITMSHHMGFSSNSKLVLGKFKRRKKNNK